MATRVKGTVFRRKKTELSKAEMREILRRRVRKLYNMSLETYVEARRQHKLPHVPGAASLEVFSGEVPRRTTDKGAHSRRR